VYSLKEGLPDNTIYSILPDQQGKLWVTTNKGIARFDPSNERVRIFKTEHGLPGDEFNRFHHIRLRNNKLVFGGTDGWIVFDPIDITEDKFEPTIALTNLRLNNEAIVPAAEGSELELPLNTTKELILSYEKNTLNISFAGLEFTQPQDLLYRYQLIGYDKDWVNAGSERQATYTKLPPGNYTFLVNASNTTGKWSPFVKSIKIKVDSPWWSSRIAYLCYLLIMISLITIFIRIRVSRALMKNSMRLKEKEAIHLKELDEIKTRFFSNITHEFRTPLTLIMGPAETLKVVQPDPAKQRQLAETIVSNSRQLLVLINRLLDLSKLEAKAMKLHGQRGDPAAVIKNVINSFFHDSEKRHVELWFKNFSAPRDCFFYPEALERIVYNLVSNALKFTHAGGKVVVSMNYSEDAMLLSVEDNGVGIPLKKLPYIYDRFYQAGDPANVSNEAADKGTGIGLSIVKELVTLLKGSIEVSSGVDTPSGTVFNLVLPVIKIIAVPAITPGEETETSNNDQPEKPQILIVEDNAELAEFVRDTLQGEYQVKTAVNGSEGLAAALEFMPDLIVSDVMMPVMDGFEFTSKLRNDIRTTHIPVILLTAKTGHENMVEGLNNGADDYLTKPFSPAELTLKIRNHLSRQEKLRTKLKAEFADKQLATVTDHSEKEETVEDVFLLKLYASIDEHLDDSLFGVDQIAAIMNISRSSLHRKLKALTGMSTTEVVRNYRLRKATEFLRAGFTSSETAYKSGFGSPAYFTKSFREVYGVTPGEYVG
ncbi:MAG: response regulator, partial [Flavitalea sp.]